MSTNRLLKLIIGITLIVTALVALQALNTASSIKQSSLPSTGMGDLRRYERESSIQKVAATESDSQSTGMGDLRRYEWESATGNAGVPENNTQSAGMGDLRRYETTQAAQFAEVKSLPPQ
jgi:hypothetical protein